ncbi:hypothetical protein BD324DRAFT_365965 [Kockovaella imperatae]|uniref:Uncharacterized protein n=1 Tax=Kockovaella imperatae TaxID=4999 RepID=A0A1Y1UKH1_9TREE|nr:hypothetical protein BD324DRAFT_365965 [Kockovaella imperatae]ORX38548.1 hypothetical protein BD324DRAFT_365965 [Kockovaella imperatae]
MKRQSGLTAAPKVMAVMRHSQEEKRPGVVVHEQGRTIKRARLSSSKKNPGKENGPKVKIERNDNSQSIQSKLEKGKSRAEVPNFKTTLAEQALMDDLMAGLDSSLFDDFDMTPSQKSQALVSSQTPTKPKRIPRLPLSPVKLSVRQQHITPKPVIVKHEPQSPQRDIIVKREPNLELGPEPVVDIKPLVLKTDPDEDFFDDLDFDVGDLFAVDEQKLLEGLAEQRYPISHPTVPSAPEGYRPTSWVRCIVQSVYNGLRSEEALLHSADDEYTGPSHLSGKNAT